MVTVAIAVILAVFALPNFAKFIENQRVKTTSQELFMSLIYARSEAIKLNAQVYVNREGTDWVNGWAVTTDPDKAYSECTSDSTDCLKIQGPSTDIDISTTAAQITYLPNGRVAADASFTICNAEASASVTKRVISIGLTGQPKTDLDGTCAA